MPAANPTPPTSATPEIIAPRCPTLLGEGPNGAVQAHTPAPILDTSSMKSRPEAAANWVNIPSGRFTPRNPLDKYTPGPLPSVHDEHPTAVFEHINVKFATEWENHKSGKLLAHPFDLDAQKIEAYETTREHIFTAVLEITKSLEVEVSAPKPSKSTISKGHSPSIFLVYNLTHEQIQFLLQQGV